MKKIGDSFTHGELGLVFKVLHIDTSLPSSEEFVWNTPVVENSFLLVSSCSLIMEYNRKDFNERFSYSVKKENKTIDKR